MTGTSAAGKNSLSRRIPLHISVYIFYNKEKIYEDPLRYQ